ncbi:MAG: flagellar brake protein [candidate division Zixibacteria bacterium]
MKNKRQREIVPIELWERLTLTLEKNGKRTEFITRVEDIKVNSFMLEMPVRQSGAATLSKGDEVEVCYNKKDASYIFKASITDLFGGENNSVALCVNGEVSREQRRRFVRLDISGNIFFRIIDSSDSGEGGLSPQVPGTLLNISAGGILFETQSSLDEGALAVLSFSLKGRETLDNVLSAVKRVEPLDDNTYLVGAEFVTEDNLADFGLESLKNILPPGTGTFDENLQKLVVQFIYKQQVELRQKGMLSQ